jgi:drug resistance transporter, EmrB/QacA subfamily
MLSTALTTAMPPIINDFNISLTTGQWMTSGYSLAMAIMMPLTAFLINKFPTRKLYCIAIIIFNIGLLVCGVSTNFPIMMVGRVIQAAGNGMLTSMSQVITLTIFPPEKRGTAMGWYGLSVGAAPILAPTLAGLLVDSVGWRMIFVIAIAIMLVSLVYALFVFDNVLDISDMRFDMISFLMSVFAFGGITLGIGNIGSYGIASIQVLLALMVGIIATVTFVYRQMNLDEPFLDLRILKDKEYANSVIGSMLLYFTMMGASVILPLYVQQTMGLSATISGLVALPGSLAMAIISPFAGKIFDKLGIKILFVCGSVCLIISNLCMYFISKDTSVWMVSGLNAIRCIAIGCLMMPLVTWGATKIEKSKTSHATALLTSLRTISGAIGSTVFVAIMAATANHSVQTYGESASIHGVNVAYLSMAGSSVILLAVAIFGCKKRCKIKKNAIIYGVVNEDVS